MTAEEKFWDHVSPEPNTGCWLWSGIWDKNGYGRAYIDGKRGLAHRWSYQHFVGEVPKGLVLDHLCRVRCCVNPKHLEAVTDRVNILRGVGRGAINKKKTHCKHGHPLSGDNVRTEKRGREHSWRLCVACDRAAGLRELAKLREANAAAGRTKGWNRRAQTHCLRGHEFTKENTRTNQRGYRFCLKCASIRREGVVK